MGERQYTQNCFKRNKFLSAHYFPQTSPITKKYIYVTGDPTVFGNLSPPEEIISALCESVQSLKFNGYAPSVGKHTHLLVCGSHITVLLRQTLIKFVPLDWMIRKPDF
jgi:hypothetical protein